MFHYHTGTSLSLWGRVSLCCPGWPWTHANWPSSVSSVLGLQAWAITHGWKTLLKGYFNTWSVWLVFRIWLGRGRICEFEGLQIGWQLGAQAGRGQSSGRNSSWWHLKRQSSYHKRKGEKPCANKLWHGSGNNTGCWEDQLEGKVFKHQVEGGHPDLPAHLGK